MFKVDSKEHIAMDNKIGEVVAWLRDAAQEKQSDWDDKSEKWQESDAASEAVDWIESLGQAADDIESAWGEVKESAS